MIYSDEYAIYDRIKQCGNWHKSVNQKAEEYARDDDGDNFSEVHMKYNGGFIAPSEKLAAYTPWDFKIKMAFHYQIFRVRSACS